MLLLATLARPAAAQSPVVMAQPTVVVPNDLNLAVISVLTADQPVSGAGYYGITDWTLKGGVYVVSLMALPPDADPNSYTIDQALWLGTLAIQESTWTGAIEGTPEYDQLTNDIYFRLIPTPMPGFGSSAEGGEDGSTYLGPLIPLRNGTSFIFGIRGVHDAGYGATGWKAVDLVSGSDYGGNYAPPDVYGAEPGSAEVKYVCRDSNGVTVKTNQYIYGHLQDNASLQVGLTLYWGVKFATLKFGTFSGTCGWAEQAPNHYHLHWGVKPATPNNIFYIGSNFIANSTTNKITRLDNGDEYSPGDTLLAMALDSNPGIDPNIEFTGDSFWDSIVGSIISFINTKILTRYPQGQEWDAGQTFVSASGSILKVIFILMSSNFKLEIFAFVVILILILEPVRTIFRVWKIIRKVIPGL